jgi:redox-sensitive bicupin YhaK (pirin superfamily)
MIKIRQSGERGYFDFGWLKTYHTFSFGDYHDPAHMGYRSLRVINEDWVAPAQGFPTHSHRDMEIVTYILQGMLEHKDSMGNTSRIKPGDVQRMSAGTGVTHSEFNALKDKDTHLLQIWIFPEKKGLTPGYEQKNYSDAEKKNAWKLVASPTGEADSVTIHQNARIFISAPDAGKKMDYAAASGRGVWLQVARGSADVNGRILKQGDGAAIEGEAVKIEAKEKSELVLFDLV